MHLLALQHFVRIRAAPSAPCAASSGIVASARCRQKLACSSSRSGERTSRTPGRFAKRAPVVELADVLAVAVQQNRRAVAAAVAVAFVQEHRVGRRRRARRRTPGSRRGSLRHARRRPRRSSRRASTLTSLAPQRSDRASRAWSRPPTRPAGAVARAAGNARQPVEQRVDDFLALHRLGDELERARLQRALARLVGRDHATPGCGASRSSFFSRSSTRQPSMSGRKMSSVIAAGWYSRGQRERRSARRRDDALEALLARGVEQELREAEVVLDDQQHAVARRDGVAVVVRLR